MLVGSYMCAVEQVNVGSDDLRKCSSENVAQLGCFVSGDFVVSWEFQVTCEGYFKVFDTVFFRYGGKSIRSVETICERGFSAKSYVYAF